MSESVKLPSIVEDQTARIGQLRSDVDGLASHVFQLSEATVGSLQALSRIDGTFGRVGEDVEHSTVMMRDMASLLGQLVARGDEVAVQLERLSIRMTDVERRLNELEARNG